MKSGLVRLFANLICLFLLFFACTFPFSDSIPKSAEGVAEIGKYGIEEINYNIKNRGNVAMEDRESERKDFKDRMSSYFTVKSDYDPIVHSFFIGGVVIVFIVVNVWISKNVVMDENDIYIDEYEDFDDDDDYDDYY